MEPVQDQGYIKKNPILKLNQNQHAAQAESNRNLIYKWIPTIYKIIILMSN